jgi:sulfate adenylyltransferase subunit 1
MEGILRIATAGSVDNGKSTLIGRLLYDSKSIFEDQLSAVERASVRNGKSFLDLSLFTDGLRDEVEQGITIDVAYRYFSTPKRKFILADTPGHFEFTRNMITGASTADAVIILIDATHGITEQTKRHAYIAGLLRIPNVMVCINKMDVCQWDEPVYQTIVEEYQSLASSFQFQQVVFVPISALTGDNVVEKSQEMNWYLEDSLLHILEHLPANETDFESNVRCVVQCSLGEKDGSFYYGVKMMQGELNRDTKLQAFPMKKAILATELLIGSQTVERFSKNTSGTLKLERDALKRGDVLISGTISPRYSNEISATICWLSSASFAPCQHFVLQHISGDYTLEQLEIQAVVDINSMQELKQVETLRTNDIAKITLRLNQQMPFDSYAFNKEMGSFILIDVETNATVAAGMMDESSKNINDLNGRQNK